MGGVPLVSCRTKVTRGCVLHDGSVVDLFGKTKPAYLDLIPSSIGPLSIVRQPINIGKSLDPHLDLSGVVKDTTGTIHVVLDRRKTVIIGGVVENRLVPGCEVWVVGDEIRKGSPLVRGSEKSWSV